MAGLLMSLLALIAARARLAHQLSGPQIGDPYWNNVVSLMHFDGTAGSDVFSDKTGKVWTVGGSAALSDDHAKFGQSGAFNGTDAYLDSPVSSDFAFGTGDFTIEMTVYINAEKSQTLYDTRLSSPATPLVIYTDNNHGAGVFNIYSSSDMATLTIPKTGLHDLQVSRRSGTSRVFLDGVLLATWADSNNYDSQTVRLAGRYAGTSDFLNGYLDEVRITKGAARNTVTYSPATKPFPDTAVTDYQKLVLRESPYAYYRLDEGSGATMLDSSGNARHGSYVGSVAWVDGIMSGSATSAQFAGGYANAGFGVSGWPTISIESWFIVPSEPTTANFAPVIGGNCANINWNHSASSIQRTVEARVSSGSYYESAYSPAPAGSLIHVGLDYDGTALRAYRNGALIAELAISGALASNPSDPDTIRISANPQLANGILTSTQSHVAIYTQSLGADRWAEHYTAGHP